MKRTILVCSLLMGLSRFVCAQGLDTLPDAQTGKLPSGSYFSTNIDSISNYNGNVMLDIPLLSLPGREVSQGVRLTYNSLKWQSSDLGGVRHGYYTGGWQIVDPTGTLSFDDRLMDCYFGVGIWSLEAVWTDSLGTRHPFGGFREGGCDQNDPPGAELYASDGSGILFISTNTQRTFIFQDGTVVDYSPTLSGLPAVYRTANGNFLTSGIGTNPQADTLGRTIGYCTNRFNPCLGDAPSDGNTYFKRYTVAAASGELQQYYLNYESHHSVTDPHYGGSGSAATTLDDWLVSIQLPNNQRYEFEYAHAQGFLTKVTLPTGATIQYVYANCPDYGFCNEVNPGHDYLYKRIVNEGNGSPGVWRYVRNTSEPARIVTMTNPDSSSIEHTFNPLGRETRTRWIEVDGTELQRVDTAWLTVDGTELPFPQQIVTTVGTLHRQTILAYDEWFHVKQQDDSDWYTVNPVPMARTFRTYDWAPLHQLRAVEVQGWDEAIAGYATESRTIYFYDEGPLAPTPAAVPNKGAPYHTRGNLTRIRRYKSVGEFVEETFAYDDLGNMIAYRDPLGNATTISYADNFSNPGYNGSRYAYPTLVTNAANQAASMQYHFDSGVVTASSNVRGQVTWSTYGPFNRLQKIVEPGGRETTYTYDDSARTVIEDVLVADGKHRTSKVFMDRLFRTVEVVSFDPAGDVHQATHYDASGRVDQVSAPYRTGESPVHTTTAYDGLGRPVTITRADGISAVHYHHSENAVTFTDEAGVQQRQVFNGLGQLVRIDESNPTLETPRVTSYSYTSTGSLTRVLQSPQYRNFSYNWLGQLVAEDHPETGITAYGYDAAGNLNHRRDARGIDTYFSYDALNRLRTVAYSDGTPSVTNSYDAAPFTGLLTQVTTGPAEATKNSIIYAYSGAGQVSSETRSFSGVSGTFTSSYTYDYDGRLLSITYPSGRVVTQSYASSGSEAVDRVATITDNRTGSPILGGVSTNAAGQVTSRTLGNGTVVSQSYNSRNQIIHIGAAQGSTNLLSMDYGYTSGSAANTGRIRSRTDNIQPEHSVNYIYDSQYRLREANGMTGWSVHWALDPFGNRTGFSSSGMASNLGNASIGINPTTNRDVGMLYDQAGNVLNDGVHNYTYDGEGRLKTAINGAVKYEYDGVGRRVKTRVGSGPNAATAVSIYGLTGLQSEFTSASGPASAASSDRLFYRVPEQTGTGVLTLSATGAVVDNNRVFPYGEPWRVAAVSTGSERFTTYTHDDLTGLDYAMARDYASRSGRFMTPDPGHIGASIGDPQSWNAYVYALDDPVNHIDPLGLCAFPDVEKYKSFNCVDAPGQKITVSALAPPRLWGRITGFLIGEGEGGGLPLGLGPCFDVESARECDPEGGRGETGLNSAPGADRTPSPFWAGVDAFFTLPSTGPGSCIQVAADAMKEAVNGSLNTVRSVSENLQTYARPVTSAMASGATSVAVNLNSMLKARQLDPFVGPAVAAGSSLVAYGANSVAATAARAVPRAGYVLIIAVEAAGIYAVIKEAKAAINGECRA
jgi:RHS repeat-associated protein